MAELSGQPNGRVVVEQLCVTDVAASHALGLVMRLAHDRVEGLAVLGRGGREAGTERVVRELLGRSPACAAAAWTKRATARSERRPARRCPLRSSRRKSAPVVRPEAANHASHGAHGGPSGVGDARECTVAFLVRFERRSVKTGAGDVFDVESDHNPRVRMAWFRRPASPGGKVAMSAASSWLSTGGLLRRRCAKCDAGCPPSSPRRSPGASAATHGRVGGARDQCR